MTVVNLREPYTMHRGNVLKAYGSWPAPATIISDGAYGVRGFHGDTTGVDDLVDWYLPHVTAWDKAATPATTLWFWNTEIGWATVHPLLVAHGWEYVQTITWDKGVSHIAGNVNGKTIRRMPVVSEVSVLYQRKFMIDTPNGPMSPKVWLRAEWQRAGLALNRANEACGVKNAATRKYLTQDWLWYWPPGVMVEKLAAYAREHGHAEGRPYFSVDGERPVTAQEWDALRYPWNHAHGLTNVWQRPPLHDSERVKGSMVRSAPRVHSPSLASASHLNQKPLEFMERQVAAVTNPGDVVWEPFGGLASASVAAVELGRRPYVAEIHKNFQDIAIERLNAAAAQPRLALEDARA
ncbi:DNA methyltransferase [Clavibacter michiganensis]|uniref:DNA methyltransferase n=1 Tax=Clavibacter michiganensis TaxID=28447 RepID=UPI0026DA8A94|nr:DNA methyltransferase [Clavibacter michiganensis]MDO4027095.1 DNA methyltransferase [Clavibacter michiganensis]MDO4036486.1 DNA methyltransferase [Clavibacter michiganensis]MDO4048685.1 DNA methyltransferase [Clavibacter michiganensis]MDO4058024.1 DNA methyltransferase [Clavibacter michiganensis]MDO4061061.1 DNA methyltransferase [Clavibacter michiganensis]